MSTSETFDVVIVGARCAGASTAMLLARAGARVLVLDREPLERDPLSTHALMRTAVAQLERWNLLDQVIAAGTPPIRAATFHYGDDQIRVDIGPRNGVDALYAPRRTVLDPILVEAAWQAGATVQYGLRVRDVVRDASGRVAGVVAHDGATRTSRIIRAGLVIGADGIGSTIARLVGAPIREVGEHSSATIYGHWPGLVADGYHWYYRPGVSVGVIPSNAGTTCMFVATPSARYRDELRHDIDGGYRRALREGAPDMADAIAGRAPVALRPFAGRPSLVRQPWGPGWALVGDAGLFRDPITAHGISDALRDAELLATAVLARTSAAYATYARARDELAREMLDVTERIASFAWDPGEIRQLHRRLSRAINHECDRITQPEDVRAAS
jgi:menaquinone-9 beta-reductase